MTDSSGAIIPGANITAVHTDTARTLASQANGAGIYVIPNAQIGAYTIEISFQGLETWKGNIVLQAGQVAEVNAALKVATGVASITVAGDVTPLVTTTNPTLATTLERDRIEQLPLDGRQIYNLIGLTTPGVEMSGSTPMTFGLRYATEFLQDGALVANRDSGFIGQRPPGVDTVQEFRVETNNSAAKMNRPASIITTTKAGTNLFHGSLFETARNNSVGIARARTDYYSTPPHFVRNEFGASAGGPVLLPKIYNGKNRTFFFASYEALRQRQNSTRSVTMPTESMRNGDFGGLINGVGRFSTLYDPLTTDSKTWQRVPFAGNQIPLSRRSPLATYLYSVTPLPTLTNVNPMVSANWYGTGFNNQNTFTFTSRFDHRVSDRDQLFVRYTHSPFATETTNALTGGPTTLDRSANGYTNDSLNDNGVISWSRTWSPRMFSETSVSFSRDHRGQLPIGGLKDYDTKLGMPNPFGEGGFPWVYTVGFTMDYMPGVNQAITTGRVLVIDQNFTRTHGRHELIFGGRFRKEMHDTLVDRQQVMGASNYNSGATAQYDPSSGSLYTAVPYSGSDAANLYLGVASQYFVRFARPWFRMGTQEISGYFQDNFKVTSRLTINLGVRYEFFGPPREKDDLLIGYDVKNKAIVVPNSIDYLVAKKGTLASIANAYAALGAVYENQQQAGYPQRFVNQDPWNFGPRLGFAYRAPGGNRPMVLRGGYSIFAYPEPLRNWNATLTSDAPTTAVFSQNWNSAAQSPDGLPNYLLRHTPVVTAGVNSTNVIDINSPQGIARGSGTMDFLNPDQPTARAHQWNLTLEREIWEKTSVKVGYIGTHGARQLQLFSLNDPPNAYIWYATQGVAVPTGAYASVAMRPLDKTTLGTIREFRKTGWSNNQAFQASIEHRFSKGFAAQAFYLMSNAMRSGGDGWRDDIVAGTAEFMPGAVPADDQARDRFLNYRRDITVPKHKFNYNWLVNLPVGKGKLLGRNWGNMLDRIAGGWQVAGSGSIRSNYFTLPVSYYNPGQVEVYGKKYPVKDCRSGVCYDGYLFWNGYIPANRINSYDPKTGKPNGVMGVPDNYAPAAKPFLPVPADGGKSTDPYYGYYDTNTVWVPMKNGTTQRIAFNDNLNPWRNQYVLGALGYALNASAFKVVKIREGMFFRFNADFFNVLNLAGTPQPGSDGIIQMRNSAYTPRMLQMTLRFTW